jgi:C_GCAxxG_C_C family probable redox protein
MDKSIAKNLFNSGFNCAQSVLLAYKDEVNVSEVDLQSISRGFGAGMGRTQSTCGAVTGAYMVLGLMEENDDEEKNKRDDLYTKIQYFNDEFSARNKSTLCNKLIPYDLSTAEGREKFSNYNLKENVCTKCVTDAIEILNSIVKSEKK